MQETRVMSPIENEVSSWELLQLNGDDKNHRYPLSKGRQNFGRGPKNNSVITDQSISINHGIIDCQDRTVVFYDIASTNGISRRGKRQPVIIIKKGQVIKIGRIYFKLLKEGREFKDNHFWKNKRIQTGLAALLSLTIATSFFWIQEDVQSAVSMKKTKVHVIKKTLIKKKTKKEKTFNQKLALRSFEEALMQKKNNPHRANKLLQTVIANTRPQSSLHRQAKKILGNGP
jgi:hypothetical protein